MTSPDLRAKKSSAAIKIRLAAANESSFKRLRIDVLAYENLRASARDARTVRTVHARCEKLPKRLRNRGGVQCDTVLALSCPTTRPLHRPPKPLTNPFTTPASQNRAPYSSLGCACGQLLAMRVALFAFDCQGCCHTHKRCSTTCFSAMRNELTGSHARDFSTRTHSKSEMRAWTEF